MSPISGPPTHIQTQSEWDNASSPHVHIFGMLEEPRAPSANFTLTVALLGITSFFLVNIIPNDIIGGPAIDRKNCLKIFLLVISNYQYCIPLRECGGLYDTHSLKSVETLLPSVNKL